MTFPAARAGDNHTCPVHGGGPILPPCSPTVTTAGQPAARVTDLCTCAGPPDTIIEGAAMVLINGLPAARVTSKTAHAGVVVQGAPTVLIGGATATFLFDIQGPAAWHLQLQEALALLYGTRTGKVLIDGIAASGHMNRIVPTPDQNGYAQADNAADGQDPSKGTPSTIFWNPTYSQIPNEPRGPAVILGHEMTHAYHNATGTNANGPYDSYPGQNGASARGEERSTVGTAGTSIVDPAGNTVPVPDYSTTVPTENSLRDDLGIPRRPTYYPPNWPGGPPW